MDHIGLVKKVDNALGGIHLFVRLSVSVHSYG